MFAARRALVPFYQWCAEVQVPEVIRLAKTVPAWLASYFHLEK